MRTVLCLVLLFSLPQILLCQERVDVADQTIKIGPKGEEVLYYGFAKGDQLIFNFDEIDGKELAEIEIVEMPENSRFKEYRIKSVRDKTLRVTHNGVYKFRFYNGALMKGRVCKVKIQRIPEGAETTNFNTGVKWVEKFDTTYDLRTETVIVRYDTVIKQKTKRVLVSTDTNVVQVLDRTERVHSMSNLTSDNVSTVPFQLPENTYSPNIFLPYKSTETISWAFSIAVGDNGKAWYEDANKKASAKAASNLAVTIGLIPSGYGALALLAIEGYSAFANPPQGENIRFQVFQGESPTSIYGDAVAASGRVIANNQGRYYTIKLLNDNLREGVNVDSKVIAVTITKIWGDENYTVQEILPIKENRAVKTPNISKSKLPVTINE